jgi:hypothetical protein
VPSTKKLVHYRASQFTGPRRLKPPVRSLNQSIKARVEYEQSLVNQLVEDADTRRALLTNPFGPVDPLLVWHDFDHLSRDYTVLTAERLPRWQRNGELLKFHALFQVALIYGGYSFTVKVRPDLEAKWIREGKDPMDRIRRETRKALEAQGLKDLAYCYVVERRTRRNSRTGIHLHGFFLAERPIVATKFKVAMEKSVAKHRYGRAAAGVSPKAGPEVDVEPCYDVNDGSKYGRGRWVSYLAKNALKGDKQLRRKTFMSLEGIQTAREFWSFIREEPPE